MAGARLKDCARHTRLRDNEHIVITICPKCELALSVTAADLRTAAGHVRCGRCAAVFNALAALYDDSALGESTRNKRVVLDLELPAEEPATASDASLASPPTTVPSESTDVASAAPPLDDVDAAGEMQTSDLASLISRGADPVVAVEDGAHALKEADSIAVEPGPLEEFTVVRADDTVPESTPEPWHNLPEQVISELAPAASDAPQADEFVAAVAASETGEPRARRAGWAVAAALLGALLLIQVVHRQRASLAAQPAFERTITGLYAALGSPVVPQWDLRSYDLQQNGAFADGVAQGALTLRASIHNRSAQPLPLPLLRVVFEDRFANRIATRDLSPAEYLAGSSANTSAERLAPGRRVDASVALADPGGTAVGFELDWCLPRTGGSIECANSP